MERKGEVVTGAGRRGRENKTVVLWALKDE